MKRYFNTTGFCRPEKHYLIEPLRGIDNVIYQLIENEQYFLIHAPRQSGKTTLLHALAKKINSEGKYISLTFSLENAGYQSITVDKAMKVSIDSIFSRAEITLPKEELPPIPDKYQPADNLLYKYLTDWSKNQKKPIVLFLDEIDALWDDVLISVLRQLRNGFQDRPKSFPVSIALIGLRDIRDYKMKIKGMDGALGSGSPFNIKAKSFMLNSFSRQQVKDLYAQHTEDTGQVFSDEIIDLVYSYSGGQPWLTNALADEITVEILENDYTKEIATDIVKRAKENLILRRDTHLDSLVDKLRDPRVKGIIQAIISGNILETDTYNDDLQYTIDLGIVDESKQGIKISNKIYAEIIPRVLSKILQDRMLPIIEPEWFIDDNKLDMNVLLKEFQQFYRENAESWIDRFSYKECGQQLLLMAFLQRITNGDGSVDREMALGRGRSDLVIGYGEDKFVLELKIKNRNYTREKSMKQLSQYLDSIGEQHGYLIAFETKSSEIIAWETRINWEETTYEWKGVTKDITVVEM